ncbi:glycine/D-amino acid oxidase-like deaminating enzyme [Breoghania corrubedonensis]|uniref:Glycine/D-amino acid oxidase-like deaminating enzyme n=1 Tax=Breoghania corrubedonensis TaxID=665038 RepID=A0A2T5VIA2_9HYPH|nr:FAD-binding oxidoreductase [Breoghania corrubedonensis]PTW63491.1 glycine/D-amino acid oxidase-like deaminating enzyme [Breoghania corrubedonensis]
MLVRDVCIVGGAAVGLSIAHFLKRDLKFDGTVTVVEKDPAYTRAATTLSAASIRQQFSTPENVRLSLFGRDFFRTLKNRFGADADIGFSEGGYLVLAGDDGRHILSENHAVQTAEGADIALDAPHDLLKRFPWLNLDGIAAGAWGRSGEGWFDAHLLLALLKTACREDGVEIITDTVTSLVCDRDRISHAGLASGETIACGLLVNAAGPAAGDLAALAGRPLPVEPRKRSVFTFRCKSEVPGLPLMVDTSGVYVRPEGATFICGVSPAEGADTRADDNDFDPDWPLFEEIIWPALAHRVPAFEEIRPGPAWAGHYDYNTLDQNAIVGPDTEISNLIYANGFSGHGLQQAPGVGRAVAELIALGRFEHLNLSIFGYQRVAQGRPVFEKVVI